MKALIFANGEPNDGEMVRRALDAGRSARIVAADGGARVAQHFDLHIEAVLGDMDSLSDDELDALDADGAQIFRYPAEKDETDLEIALQWVAKQGCDWIRIIGGIGGRFDQALANVYLLALPELENCDVEIVAGSQAIRLLQPGTHIINGQPDDTISLLPVGGDVEGITTQAMKYPLEDDVLYFGPARGISNVMNSAVATVTHKSGVLLLIHTVGRA